MMAQNNDKVRYRSVLEDFLSGIVGCHLVIDLAHHVIKAETLLRIFKFKFLGSFYANSILSG